MKTALPVSFAGVDPAVLLEGVVKRYRRQVALDDANLTVPEGAFYALIGQNGAGKTTTIRLLLDLTRADAGRIEVFGRDVVREGAAVRVGIGYIPEGDDLGYGWMKVDQLLRHHASYYPQWDDAYAERLVGALGIDRTRRYGEVSKGQRRRVQLVMALGHRPPLLLLDEPTDGLDPVMRDEVRGLLADHLAESPATVVVSTHRLYELDGLVDHVGVLRDGRVIAQVSADDLRGRLRRYRLRIEETRVAEEVLDGTVVTRRVEGREAAWTVWGEFGQISASLREAGASVSEVETLTLDEAALEILKTEA